jgi:hypothetical protein
VRTLSSSWLWCSAWKRQSIPSLPFPLAARELWLARPFTSGTTSGLSAVGVPPAASRNSYSQVRQSPGLGKAGVAAATNVLSSPSAATAWKYRPGSGGLSLATILPVAEL